MQPGYPGQDPYGQQQPQYGQDPQYGQQPPQYGQQPPQYGDPYAQPQQPQYGDPYAQPTSGQPYGQPTSGQPYGQPTSGQPYGQPTPGQPYPAAPAYPTPGYGVPAPTGQQNTQGLLAMIFGIIAIPLAICCPLLGIGSGIAALILGFLGKKKAEQGLASNRGMAMAGLICGGIGTVLSIGWIIASLALNLNSFNTTNF
jgi:hypothetical protein